MKTLLIILVMMAVAVLAGCNGSANTMNVNRSNSTNSTPMNSNMNMNSNANGVNTNSNSTASSKSDFWNEAALGGMEEVEMGRLASTKAVNAEVKKFGQLMVTDHSKANDELKAAAAKKNITVPTALDPRRQADVDKLKGLSGAEFDREYVEMMLDDHEEDVAAFQAQAETGTDPDAKAFAAKTLPTLKKHLELIKGIEGKMK